MNSSILFLAILVVIPDLVMVLKLTPSRLINATKLHVIQCWNSVQVKCSKNLWCRRGQRLYLRSFFNLQFLHFMKTIQP